MHPYLNSNIVTNNIKIGHNENNNIIITGANGVNPLIKSLSISLLFSQTLGISFAKIVILHHLH